MTKSSSYRGFFAAAAVLALWAALPGCVPSAGSYCKKVCECSACDDAAEASCVDNVSDAQRRASGKECGGEFDAFLSCVDGKTTCEAGITGCESQQAALQTCAGEIAFGFGGGCISYCQRVATECGSGTPDQCSAQCASLEQSATATGCGGPLNDILTCYAALSDVCSGSDQCYPQASTYAQCVSNYCNQNPGAPGC